MGAIISILRDAINGIRSIAILVVKLSAVFNAALKRASRSPGLPVSNPTQPYWLNDPPFPELVDGRSPELPKTADVVIIGSGIAGVAIARSLLGERRRLAVDGKVVVFDARQLCSGATARNGGHIKPPTYETFSHLSKKLPTERAVALTRFQARHLDCLLGLCQAEGIDLADAREVETADLYLDEETFQTSVKKAEAAKACIPEFNFGVLSDLEARERYGVNDSIVGALTYRAGSIWGYRFVVSIWKRLLDEFCDILCIETNNPIQSISVTENEPSGFPYALHTVRGIIHARHVVHATNAFAGHLVPGLRGKITGIRAHMSAQRPGNQFPHSDGKHSWGVVYGGAFDYVTQRPSTLNSPKGDLMIGGAFTRSPKQGIDQVGLYDDGSHADALTVAHLAGIFPAVFSPKWGAGAEVRQVWTGLLDMTGDLLPFVGRLDEALTGRKCIRKTAEPKSSRVPGEWIAAGFCGEGMVWAWLCGTALGIMIAGSEEEDLPEVPGRPGGKLMEWFPKELIISKERVQSADVSNLANHT